MFGPKLSFVIGMVGLGLIAGCGEGPDFPDTVSASGTVTYNGSPVEGAVVSFSPQGDGHAATGTTDASGNFTLTSFEAGDGAVPGSYNVAISKIEGGAATDVTAGGGSESEEDMDAAYEAAESSGVDMTKGESKDKAGVEAKNLLPQKYAAGATSGLTEEVTAAGPNTYTFELTD